MIQPLDLRLQSADHENDLMEEDERRGVSESWSSCESTACGRWGNLEIQASRSHSSDSSLIPQHSINGRCNANDGEKGLSRKGSHTYDSFYAVVGIAPSIWGSAPLLNAPRLVAKVIFRHQQMSSIEDGSTL